MENMKINWKLLQKAKNPRSQQELAAGKLKTFWKQQKKVEIFAENCKTGRQGRANPPQITQQKSPTALKRLDISIKCASKMTRQFCYFCTIQQRKSPWHLFCHGLMAERKGFEPLRALGALHDFQSCALDQLSHLSTYSVVQRLTAWAIIAIGAANVKQKLQKILENFPDGRNARKICARTAYFVRFILLQTAVQGAKTI